MHEITFTMPDDEVYKAFHEAALAFSHTDGQAALACAKKLASGEIKLP